MGLLTTVYALIALLTGVPALFRLGWALGLCGTISPWVALGAGGGLAAAIRGRGTTDTSITVILGIVLVAVAIWRPYYVGWHLLIFGHDVPGTVENIIGVALGFMFGASKKLNPLRSDFPSEVSGGRPSD